MFEPFMKSFYVRSTDATHIKTLKVKQACLHFIIVLCYIAVSMHSIYLFADVLWVV